MKTTAEEQPRDTSFKRYAEYKDPGIAWLGKIPKHWDATRLKYLCEQSALYGANIPASEYVNEGIRFLRTSDIDDKGNLLTGNEVLVELSKAQEYLLKDGDLLLSRSGTIGRSFLYTKEEHGVCAYAGYLVRFVPNFKLLLPKFGYYYTKSTSFSGWLSFSVVETTIANVNGKKFANMQIPLPQLREQHAITSFLNYKTDQIDTLISKKEHLIELLEEKRTALITKAVTKGPDPDVPKKASGIEWLGEIPEHWDIKKLKHISKVNPSNVDKKKKGSEPPVKLCNYTDVYYQDTITSDTDFMEATASTDEIKKFQLEKGDTLITKDSEAWKDIAVPAYVPENFSNVLCGYHLAQLKPDEQIILGKYLFYSLLSKDIAHYFKTEAKGVTRYGLTTLSIKDVPLMVPPKDEQEEIITLIDQKCSKIDELIFKIRKAIDKLKEYRQALITNAVTGRIDVRDWEPPEESTEQEVTA